ncbi:schlafen-like protein 1 isoform X1 [Pocillopora verrucosa]|uniref:schlafen-like protein 1 isoform X1 n=1 Tax=Pocillopora verrucosa TaxID=203993 RepID=UPI00333F3FD2
MNVIKMQAGGKYPSNEDGRVYFFFPKMGYPSGNFHEIITKYVNALLNTKGGVLVFGVDPVSCKILGCHVNRAQEDLFRLEFDKEVRNMRPTVSPSLCRFILTKLENSPLCVLEVKISAAPIGEMYMNSSEQVYVIRQRKLFGPLRPQEIKDLVIAKYREEISSTVNLLSPAKESHERVK